MTRLVWGSATDVGRVREANQDSFVAEPGIFAVADGMGGHNGGEVASAMALAVLRDRTPATTSGELAAAVRAANSSVFGRSVDEPELRGMGTTLVALAQLGGDAGLLGLANIGDSRAYLFAEGALTQLSEDHSLVESLVREGKLTPEEALHHPRRNILVRALGIEPDVAVDLWEIRPAVGDRFLLCSDGLFNEVDDAGIARLLAATPDPAAAAAELVRLANSNGGRDNISVVIVDVVEGAAAAPIESRLARVPATAAPAVGAPPSADDETQIGALPGAVGAVGAPPVDAPAVAPTPQVEATSPPRRHRRVTWRVLVFAVVLLAIVGAVVGLVGWYARNTWYVGFDEDDQVAIYRGRPGGFLWFEPTLEQDYEDLDRSELTESQRRQLDEGKEEATLADAEAFVENLTEPDPDTTSTTTTTTTKPPDTTTTAVAPTAPSTTAPPTVPPTAPLPPGG